MRQRSQISDAERAIRFGQQPCTILLTGLTAAGKSTLATALERELFDRGKVSIRLDGENVRMGISRDLGFSTQERSENLRRVSEVARLVNGAASRPWRSRWKKHYCSAALRRMCSTATTSVSD